MGARPARGPGLIAPGGLEAHAELVAGPGGRIERMTDAPPVAFRPTPRGVYLVGTAASPTGGDRVGIDVTVRPSGRLRVRSSAATVVWAGTGSSQRTRARVGAGAALDWRPEGVVVTAGADHVQHACVDLDPAGALDWTEVAVLGRTGEKPGRADLRLDVDVAGAPLLRHQLRVGPDAPGWDGPAVLGTHRAVALRLVAGRGVTGPPEAGRLGPGWAWMELDGPGWLLLAVAADPPGLAALLDGPGAVVKVPAG